MMTPTRQRNVEIEDRHTKNGVESELKTEHVRSPDGITAQYTRAALGGPSTYLRNHKRIAVFHFHHFFFPFIMFLLFVRYIYQILLPFFCVMRSTYRMPSIINTCRLQQAQDEIETLAGSRPLVTVPATIVAPDSGERRNAGSFSRISDNRGALCKSCSSGLSVVWEWAVV